MLETTARIFRRLAEKLGVSFAFPTQSLHLVKPEHLAAFEAAFEPFLGSDHGIKVVSGDPDDEDLIADLLETRDLPNSNISGICVCLKYRLPFSSLYSLSNVPPVANTAILILLLPTLPLLSRTVQCSI